MPSCAGAFFVGIKQSIESSKENLTFAALNDPELSMKHIYRILLLAFAFVWADVAWAQSGDEIFESYFYDTCSLFQNGVNSFNQGDSSFKNEDYSLSETYFREAIPFFEQYIQEHPWNRLAQYYLGYSYYYLAVIHNLVFFQCNDTVIAYTLEAIHLLPASDTTALFICYSISGFCLANKQYDCDAYYTFQTALNYDLDFSSDPTLLYLYKRSLYGSSFILYSSYTNSVSSTTNLCTDRQETPTWDDCVGGNQLDHCIDDLNRLINIEQPENDKNQIDTLALVLLGECYYYKNEFVKSKECYEKSGNPNLYDEIIEKDSFIKHFNQGICLFNGDTLSGIEPDYCGAFQEFDKAIGCDISFNDFPEYFSVLYLHANLLFLSYCVDNQLNTNNPCGDVEEIPGWATCIGGQELDRCMDDLNRLINIKQAESNKNQIDTLAQLDTLAFVLLGKCYYYKGEYKKATECYEKSGMAPGQLDVTTATFFWDSYNSQGIIESEQTKALAEATVEGWRNDPTYYRSLYLDDAGAMSDMAHFVMEYYIDKEEYDKAFDFWYKIKNNFSLDTTLIYYEGICRYHLGDPTALEQMEFAIRMNPTSSRIRSNYLAMQMMQGKFSSQTPLEDSVFTPKQNDTLYYKLKGLAYYYEKDYNAAKKCYDDVYDLDPSPDNALMLALCYQKIVETKSQPETRHIDSIYARKYFQAVVSKEEMVGKYSYAPYAYYYLNDYDKAVETMEDILHTELVSPAMSDEDKKTCHNIHYQAAEVYALVGNKKKAKNHFKQALEYQHDPLVLSLAENAPLLASIHEYVEQEVRRYREQQDIMVSPIHRDTLFCNVPFGKNGISNTKTINCKINGKQVNNMLFDPGADYIQLTQCMADSIGVVEEDKIGWVSPKDANGRKVCKQLVSLNTVEFGDIVLENVQAIIEPNPTAPLLLGCTVWNNLKVEMPSPVSKGMIRLTYIKESIDISSKNTDKPQSK